MLVRIPKFVMPFIVAVIASGLAAPGSSQAASYSYEELADSENPIDDTTLGVIIPKPSSGSAC